MGAAARLVLSAGDSPRSMRFPGAPPPGIALGSAVPCGDGDGASNVAQNDPGSPPPAGPPSVPVREASHGAADASTASNCCSSFFFLKRFFSFWWWWMRSRVSCWDSLKKKVFFRQACPGRRVGLANEPPADGAIPRVCTLFCHRRHSDPHQTTRISTWHRGSLDGRRCWA